MNLKIIRIISYFSYSILQFFNLLNNSEIEDSSTTCKDFFTSQMHT